MSTTNACKPADLSAAKPDGTRVVEILQIIGALPGTAHLTSREAALHIGTTPEVLRVWRSIGKGPRFKGRGHFVRYLKSDLDDFMSGYDHRFDARSVTPR